MVVCYGLAHWEKVTGNIRAVTPGVKADKLDALYLSLLTAEISKAQWSYTDLCRPQPRPPPGQPPPCSCPYSSSSSRCTAQSSSWEGQFCRWGRWDSTCHHIVLTINIIYYFILPVGRRGAVHVIIPVADSKLLVEARLIGTHVGNPAAVLVTHVEYLVIGRIQHWSLSLLSSTNTHHAVKFQISVESDRSVCAVEIESDIGKVGPSLLLKLNVLEGLKSCWRSVIQPSIAVCQTV